MVKEDYLATRVLQKEISKTPFQITRPTHRIENILNGFSIICVAITDSAIVLHAHELIDGIVYILRVRPPDDPAIFIKQNTWFGRGLLVRLHERAVRIVALINIALDPVLDREVSTLEDGRTVVDADGGSNVLELDVVEHQRPSEGAVG